MLRGRLREALGASAASQTGSWELLGRPRERLRVLLGRLGEPFWSLLGLRERVGSRKDRNMEFVVFPKEFLGF